MVKPGAIRTAYVLSDWLMLSLGWLMFNLVRFHTLPAIYVSTPAEFLFHDRQVVLGQVLIPLMMLFFYWLSGFYNEVVFKSRLDDLRNGLVVSVFGTLVIYFVVLVNDHIPERMAVYETMSIMLGLLCLPLCAARLLITGWCRREAMRGPGFCRAIVIGPAHDVRTLKARLNRERKSPRKFDIAGTLGPDCSDPAAEAERLGAQAFIIATPEGATAVPPRLLDRLYRTEKQIYITPGMYQMLTSRPHFDGIVDDEPLVNITNANLSPTTVNFKRIGDVIISAVALVALAPVYLLLAAVVKSTSPGPVFYSQERIGYHKRRFKIIKFRTMYTDAEAAGPALSGGDRDPRITRPGHFMRKYRLDELPQFWNVLRGDMSLVGPRPERDFYIRQIQERVPYFGLIHQVRPGLTSWGAVKFGYATDVDQMVRRLRYDLLYIENVSISLDLKILLYTVRTVLTGQGK